MIGSHQSHVYKILPTTRQYFLYMGLYGDQSAACKLLDPYGYLKYRGKTRTSFIRMTIIQ